MTYVSRSCVTFSKYEVLIYCHIRPVITPSFNSFSQRLSSEYGFRYTTRLNMPVLQNQHPQPLQSDSPAPPVVPEVLPVAPPVEPVVAPVVPVVAPLVPVIPEKLTLAQRVTFPADDYTVNPAEAGSASLGTVSNIPGKLAMKVNTTALTENSMVFLTPLGRGPTLVAVSDLQPSLGQFTIAAGSVCTVNWLIIN
jgi:hypothetical protein